MLGYHIYENDNQKYKDRYGCGICELISRNPAQISPCGHRFCESCITGYKRKNTTKSKTLKCPLDDEPVEQIFPDKFAEREILGLFVACDGTDDGCSWKGEIREIEAHQDKCRLRPVPCDNKGCKKKVALQFLEKHREQCEHRLTRCPHCGKQLTHKHLKILD